MRVLVACERSGRVRDALLARGHDAVSCDIELSDAPGPHIAGRVEDVLGDGWDMVIGFPPCTHLASIGYACHIGRCVHRDHYLGSYQRWRRGELIRAAELFWAIRQAAPRTAVENPQPHPLAAELLGPHNGYSEPYHHGDPWRKRTLWWLTGLQPLHPTRMTVPQFRWISGQSKRRHGLPGRPGDRGQDPARSLTPLGTAEAIADQWGSPEPQTLF